MEHLPTFNNMDWFDDIFDVVSIDDDINDDKNEVERMILEDYYEDFDIYSDQEQEEDDDDVDEGVDVDHQDNQSNKNVGQETKAPVMDKDESEQVLSQKLNELSTEGLKRPLSTPTSSQNESLKKKICLPTKPPVQQSNQMTSYLEAMDEMFNCTMSNNTNVISFNKLQLFMDYKYQMNKAQLHLQRWQRYYQAGTQQQIWSKEVKKLFKIKQYDDKTLYQSYVQEYLDEINGTIEHLQQQIKSYKEDYPQLKTDKMETKLDEFIQCYRLLPTRIKSDYELAQFEYDYQDQLLEREFLQWKPTEQQIEIATNLCKTYHQYSQTNYELIELKQRIQCHRPTEESVTQALSMIPTSTTTNTNSSSTDSNYFMQEIDHDDKQFQKHLNQSMTKAIVKVEEKISQCQRLYQEQQQWAQSILTSSFMDIMYRRQKLYDEKLHCKQVFHLNYYLRRNFGQQLDEFNLPKTCFSPTVIVHASMHVFEKEHLQLLSRGPTYVLPYQMVGQDLKKIYKQLQHDLNKLFARADVNLVRSMHLQTKIRDIYMEMFSPSTTTSTTISKEIYERRHYEKQLLDKIRHDLKTFNLILRRTADQRNVFYLGDRQFFDNLTNEFMLKTDFFEVDTIVNNDNLQETRDYLTMKIKSMNHEFETIFHDKIKYRNEIKNITVIIAKMKLPYLYFLPDLSTQPLLDVKPIIMSTKQSATYPLGQYLDQLLRPIINIHQQGHTFNNGADFLRKFRDSIANGHRLKPTTQFVTITIDHFYRLVSHDRMLNTLSEFFIKSYHLPYVGNVHFTKILQLTRLFLNSNRFYYDGKIYRFTKGGPINSTLIETLSNMYLGQIEKSLVDERLMLNEFYGRYQNQIFFTWNQSMDELYQLLEIFTLENDHLTLAINIQQQLTYLDIYLENRQGLLYSRIHHSQNQQSFTLPYISNGNALRQHTHWLRSSLIRTVRYCSSVEDFNQERIYLEMTYLANGYSYEFIDKHMQHFFKHFDGKQFQQLCFDQHLYEKFRHRLFNFMYEQRQYMLKKKELLKTNRCFQLSYLYNNIGSQGKFNKMLREILSENIQFHHPTFERNKLQFDITTKQQHSLNSLLSEQRPTHPILNKIY